MGCRKKGNKGEGLGMRGEGYITVVDNRSSHDRFLIIDNTKLFHIGASLKDLGNSCFAFSRMDDLLDAVKTNLLRE